MRLKIVPELIGVLLSTVLLVHGCASFAEDARQEKAIPVQIAPVLRQEISLPVHTSGKLFTAAEMKLSFKIPGLVRKIYVDEGQSVPKSRILAELDDTEIRAQFEQAQNAFEKAGRDLERARQLFADSVATLEQLQNAQTAFHIAEAALKIARFNLRHSAIRAPGKGTVLKQLVEENEMVAAGTPVLVFGSVDKSWLLRVGVADRDVVRLALGDSAAVFFDAYPGRRFSARITEISEAVNPMNGTFEVELQLSAGAFKLMSGFVADVDIFPSRMNAFLTVPIEAVVEADADRGFVYTLEPDSAVVHKVAVRTGPIYGTRIAILSGPGEREHVVTLGAPYLQDGAKVRIIAN